MRARLVSLGVLVASVAACSSDGEGKETFSDSGSAAVADPKQSEGARDGSSSAGPSASDAGAAPLDASREASTPAKPISTAAMREDAGPSGSANVLLDASSSSERDAARDGASEDAAIDAHVAPPVSASCLRVPTRYDEAGGYRVLEQMVGRVRVFAPEIANCAVPVVHFSNGTGASCTNYRDALTQLASHGFLAVCVESPNTVSGNECFEALEAARAQFPTLAGAAIGSAGHHTGASGALLCLERASSSWGANHRYAGYAVALMAGSGGGHGWTTRYGGLRAPIFAFRGTNDVLVSKESMRRGLDALPDDAELLWYEAVGATSVPVPVNQMKQTIVAWFRWKLLGDAAACRYLKALPQSEQWDLELEQMPSGC